METPPQLKKRRMSYVVVVVAIEGGVCGVVFMETNEGMGGGGRGGRKVR